MTIFLPTPVDWYGYCTERNAWKQTDLVYFSRKDYVEIQAQEVSRNLGLGDRYKIKSKKEAFYMLSQTRVKPWGSELSPVT